MAKYKLLGKEDEPKSSVEINGERRFAGEILDESEFKPRPTDAPEEELSELESLLQSGHIALVTEE